MCIDAIALQLLDYYKVPIAVLSKGGQKMLRDVDVFQEFGTRITVGAGGHLYTDETRTKKLYDKLWIKLAGIRQASLILEQSYLTLKKADGFHWTYMAPPTYYIYDGKRTGQYQSGVDVLLKNSRGKSKISYADYAMALINEAESPKHLDRMFTVCGC